MLYVDCRRTRRSLMQDVAGSGTESFLPSPFFAFEWQSIFVRGKGVEEPNSISSSLAPWWQSESQMAPSLNIYPQD